MTSTPRLTTAGPRIAAALASGLTILMAAGGAHSAAAARPASSSRPVTGATEVPVLPGETGAHQIFDDSQGPPHRGVARGAEAGTISHPKHDLGPRTPVSPGGQRPHSATGGGSGPRDPEVLGFAQSGEIDSGSWSGDLRMDLLSTIAYFGVIINGDGSVNTGDYGYQVWRGAQTTNLINAAHAAGDRVLLTIKQFDTATINAIVQDESHRQNAVNQVINELTARGGDGVDVDFEGAGSSSGFTTFVAELQYGLRSRVADRSYLVVDTYGSSYQGGTMMDIGGLSPYTDAFDVMAYDLTSPSSSHAGPVAPLNGYAYTVTGIVNGYLGIIPASQLILGVPYYGYKWSATTAGRPGPLAATAGTATAETFSALFDDFACAQQLQETFDQTYWEPWATWYSPPSNDPCGGNRNAWREMYYEDGTALSGKFDLDNNRGLRGIGIWALGYDSGHPDLWNLIAAKFAVSHFSVQVVEHLYQDLLGRPADAGGLQTWSSALNGGSSRAWVAYQLVTSSEYRHRAAAALYSTLLHRTPSSGDLEFWATALASYTDEQARAAFMGSDEYWAVRGGSTTDGFITAVYSDALGRTADDGGRAHWTDSLAGGASRTAVAAAIVGSPEGLTVLVGSMYTQILHRAGDSGGVSSWVSAIQRGSTDEQVMSNLAGSPEYYLYATTH